MGACRKMPIFVDMCSADSAGGCRHLSAAPREDSHNARAAFRACHQRSLVKPDDNNRNHRNHRNHRNPETDSKYLKMIQDDTNNSFMWTETYILYHLLNMWQLCGNYVNFYSKNPRQTQLALRLKRSLSWSSPALVKGMAGMAACTGWWIDFCCSSPSVILGPSRPAMHLLAVSCVEIILPAPS